MFKRWLPCLPLLLLLTAPLPVAAQDKQEQPTLVVRLKSLDSLFENLRLVVNPLVKQDIAGQLDILIKIKTGSKGLEGIDTKRPIGLYGHLGADLTKIAAVLMVPVSDEKTFLTTLNALNFKATKDATGLYTVKQTILPMDVFFRFAHKYAYLTAINAEAVDQASLLAPKAVFTKELRGFLSATLHLEAIPDNVKKMIAQQVADNLAAGDDKKADETKAQQSFRVLLTREVRGHLAAAIRDGKDLTFELDVHKRTGVLSVDVQLTPLPSTELAKTISKLGERRSLFGGLMAKDAALNLLVHLQLSEKLHEALNAVIDEGGQKAIAETKEEGKKIQVTKLMEAVMPSLKAGELDAAISLRGPSVEKTYTLVAAVKLREVKQLTATLLELLKDIPATERPLIKFNVDKVGDVGIHRLDARKQFDAKTKAVFGENFIFIAFRQDAVFLVLGEDGLEAIKKAVAAPVVTTPPLQLEMSLSRMIQVFAKTDEELKLADKLLSQGKTDRLRVTLEGGSALHVHFETHLSLLETFGLLAEQKKADKEK